MKNVLFCLLGAVVLLFSCKDNNQKRIAENKKETAKKEIIFSNIKKGWVFYDSPINETAEASVATWGEFRLFLGELAQKPKKSLAAYQQKADAIAKTATNLNNNIPIQFDKPEIKSRIAVVITKVQMMNLFIHLDKIPDKKVVTLISEINRELASLQREMDKIAEKNKIPVEEGESEMKQMLDNSRAIPNSTVPNNAIKLE